MYFLQTCHMHLLKRLAKPQTSDGVLSFVILILDESFSGRKKFVDVCLRNRAFIGGREFVFGKDTDGGRRRRGRVLDQNCRRSYSLFTRRRKSVDYRNLRGRYHHLGRLDSGNYKSPEVHSSNLMAGPIKF